MKEQEIESRIKKVELELSALKLSYGLHKHTKTDGTRGIDTSIHLTSSASVNLGLVSISSGIGTPEGTLVAYIGSVYFRTDGGASTTFYVKESANGSAFGWVSK